MKQYGLVAMCFILASAAVVRATEGNEIPIKDDDGKTLAMVVICNECQAGAAHPGKTCHTGAEEGWLNGSPCGRCLVDVNSDLAPRYPYDVHIAGTLTDDAGKPLNSQFVKLFLADGVTERTYTSEQGTFRLRLGATAARKSKKPVVTDIGVRTDAPKGKDKNFALFMMPESYRPCPPRSAAAPAAKPPAAKAKKATKAKK